MSNNPRAILDHLAALSDPRQQWRVVYPLPEILLLVLCATLSGMEDFVETKLWGEQRFPGLAAIAMVETCVERNGTTQRERGFYLSSAKLDAKTFATAVRAHRHIENRLHWVLDAVFHDDLARLRTGCGPQNMAVVKHMAMNLVRSPCDKHSLKVRRKLANLNPDDLQKLITAYPR